MQKQNLEFMKLNNNIFTTLEVINKGDSFSNTFWAVN